MQSIISRLISLFVCLCLLVGLMPFGLFSHEVKAEEIDNDILYSCDFETEDVVDNLFFLDADGDGNNWVREDDFTNNYGLVSCAVSGTFNVFRTPYILLPDTENSTLSFKVRTDGPADYIGGLKVYIYVQEDSSSETLAASYILKDNDTDRTNPGTFQVDLSEWKGKNVVIEFDNNFRTGVYTEGFTVRIDDILVTAPAKKTVEISTFEQLRGAITMDTIDGRTLNLKLTDDVICDNDGDGMMIELKDKKQRVVLDLNGHALIRRAKTKNDFALINLSQGELTVKDSSDGNGMIEASLTYNGVYIYPYSATICVGGDSRLTVEGGLIASSKGVDSAVFMRYGCTANVTINGGMFNGAKYGIYTQDSNAEHMTINGREFKGGLLGICAVTYSPYIRINNAVSYAPVQFATSRSNVPSNIAPNTVVTVYKNESEIDSVYKDTTDYSSSVLQKRLYITDCYKIEFSTKSAIRWIKLTGALPRPGEIAGLGYIPEVSSGSVNVRDCRWLGEYGDEFAGEFKENISYTLRVTLEVGQDESFSNDIVAMVCGNKAEVAFADLAGKKVMVSYKFPPTETRKLTGEVQFTSAANPDKAIDFVVKNLPDDLSVNSLQYLWQKKVGDAWEIIEEDDATKKSFAPSADLLGKEVRVVITEPKSTGVIVSRSITVTKLFNMTAPVAPVLKIKRDDDGGYTGLVINNYYETQEYVYLTSKVSDISTIDWTSNTFLSDTIPVESVTVSPDEVKMAPGAQKTLTALVNPVNTTVSDTMTWGKVSGSDNISVDESGKVTVSEAATEGELAVIQAKYGDKTGTCSVIVEKDTYFVTITDGMAYVGTKNIVSAKVGMPVSIKADEAPEGKKFDHWVVESGNALPENADSSVTCFIMPAGDVKIKATYKDIPAEVYQITVTDGVATVDGISVTGAEAGTVVTLMANAAATGKVFDKWVVESGSVTLADSNNATTSFEMPAGDVSVRATYKDEVPSPGVTDDEGKAPVTEDGGKVPITADKGSTPVTSDIGNTPAIDNNALKVGKTFIDESGKATYRVIAAAEAGSTVGGQPEVEYVAPVSKTSKTITIPSTVKAGGVTYKVTSIGKKALYSCKKLKTVTIGKNVTSIGKKAFYSCKKLKKVIIKTTKLTNKKVHKTAFGKNAKKVTVTLPKMAGKKKAAYKKMLKTKGLKAAK